ncbi:MAG: hypothetical protein AAF433_04635 [Bacteroidota bacterium]
MRYLFVFLLALLYLNSCSSRRAIPAEVQNKSPNSSQERVYVMPIGEGSPITFGVFDPNGQLLYSLPYGSRPYSIRSVAPLNPAVLNRLIMLPDSSMVWAKREGWQSIEGLDGRQIMRVARCVDLRFNLANYLYWKPNDNFCACYRMQDHKMQKFYFSPQGSLIRPQPFSPVSGPMQDGFALVKAFDPEEDEYGRSKDALPWQLLNREGELLELELDIFKPVSPFHQGRALVLLNTQAQAGQNLQLAVINTRAELLHTIDIPPISSFGIRLNVAEAMHGYFLLKKRQQSENNNFLVLDLNGQEVRRFEQFSDLQILGPDRFLIREQGAGRNQGAAVRLENRAGEILQRWENVKQIMPPSGLSDTRILAIGEAPNQQLWQINADGERLHRLMGKEAYELGEDQYLVMRGDRRQRSLSWETRSGEVFYNSRWMEEEQAWPLADQLPLWAINRLEVKEELASALGQLSQMPALTELHLPALPADLSIELQAPLSKLRKLRINKATAAQLQALIQQMPQLTELNVSYLTGIEEELQLPLLEQLGKVGLIVKGAAPLYDWLRQLPALYNLSISSDDPAFLQEVQSWRDAHRWNIRANRVYFDGAESDGAILQEDEPVMMETAPDRG